MSAAPAISVLPGLETSLVAAVGQEALPRLRAPRRCESPATYRRRRLGAAVILVALIAAALWALPAPSGTDGSEGVLGDVSAVVVVVEPGDTLWEIARDLQPSGDIRPLVDSMSEIAGRASLQAGQEIRIPADLLRGG